MTLTWAVVIALISVIAAFVATVLAAVVAVRRRAWVSVIDRDASGYLRRTTRDPVPYAAFGMIIATVLPWVSGSAVGVPLPSTLWGLPWARWWISAPVALVLAVVLTGWHRERGLAQVVAALLFALCVAVGSLALVLAALAQRVSHLTFVADTLLRGLSRSHDVLPVIRVGSGELVFIASGLAGAYLVAIRFRRETVPPPSPSALAAGLAEAGTSVTSDSYDLGNDW